MFFSLWLLCVLLGVAFSLFYFEMNPVMIIRYLFLLSWVIFVFEKAFYELDSQLLSYQMQ